MRNRSSTVTLYLAIGLILAVGVILALLAGGGGTSTAATATDSMAGHHGGTNGPTTDPTRLVGAPAPDFTLTATDGTAHTLAQHRGQRVVLFFNEGMMCYPACWNQIAALGSDPRFATDSVVAFSVVTDSASAWQRALKQMPDLSKGTVLHDTGASVSRAYGMLTTKSSMHFGQLPGHTYVVVDDQGIVRHVYDDPNMALHNEQLATEVAALAG